MPQCFFHIIKYKYFRSIKRCAKLLHKFKFNSKKEKSKFNFIFDKNDFLNSEITLNPQIQLFSNRKMILYGCNKISDYRSNYVNLKFKKGFLILEGENFTISTFEEEKIIINGKITSIEFNMQGE